MNLSIDIRQENNQQIADVSGEIDIYTAGQLKESLLPLVTDQTTVTVNMANVNYIDSTGLSVFISVLKSTKENGGYLKLVNVQDSVARMFDITGLDKIIDVSTSVQEGSES